MGLHIYLVTDNYKAVYSTEFYQNEKEYRSKMCLSRNFAELMARLNPSFGEAELKQVERVAGINLSSLWEMATYNNGEGNIPNGNIGTVIKIVSKLVERLNAIENLQTKIEPYDNNIGFDYYFSDFSNDKSNDLTDNNFGQDLRNLKRLLDYALSKGASKVWFDIE